MFVNSSVSANGKAALEYAEMGWPIIPIKPTEKKPCVRMGKGFHLASSNAEVIFDWWKRFPDANVATLGNPRSGFFSMDVDVPKEPGSVDGRDSLHELERIHGRLPETVCFKSGSGGEQYFWRHPGWFVKSTTSHIEKGIDVRGDYGLIVLPPSVHKNGCLYGWDASPDEFPIAEAPDWILQKIKFKNTIQTSTFTFIYEGKRNQTLISLAGVMRSKGMDMGSIEAAIMNENKNRCIPPLPEAEVEKIIRSIGQYPAGKYLSSSIGIDKEDFQRLCKLPLEPSKRLVYIALGYFKNLSSGICFPSQQTIAEMTSLNRCTVSRAITELCEMGLIEKVNNCKSRSNAYRFPEIS